MHRTEAVAIPAHAFEEHGQTEHFQTFGVGEIFPLMESRERNFYETFD